MHRLMAAVLGSLVLTLSVVVVWPVTAGSVGWHTGGWIGAEAALADDADVEPGWYEVGESASGTSLYRHYGSDGWGSMVTRDPWAVQVTELILELLTSADGSGFLSPWLASTLGNILVRPYVERGFQPLPSSPPTVKPAAPDAMTSSSLASMAAMRPSSPSSRVG